MLTIKKDCKVDPTYLEELVKQIMINVHYTEFSRFAGFSAGNQVIDNNIIKMKDTVLETVRKFKEEQGDRELSVIYD